MTRQVNADAILAQQLAYEESSVDPNYDEALLNMPSHEAIL